MPLVDHQINQILAQSYLWKVNSVQDQFFGVFPKFDTNKTRNIRTEMQGLKNTIKHFFFFLILHSGLN